MTTRRQFNNNEGMGDIRALLNQVLTDGTITLKGDASNPVLGDMRELWNAGTKYTQRYETQSGSLTWVSLSEASNSLHTDKFVYQGVIRGLYDKHPDGHMHPVIRPSQSLTNESVVVGDTDKNLITTGTNTYFIHSNGVLTSTTFQGVKDAEVTTNSLDFIMQLTEWSKITKLNVAMYFKIVSGQSTIVGQSYEITTRATADFTTIGASNNNPGTTFIASGVLALGAGDELKKRTGTTKARFKLYSDASRTDQYLVYENLTQYAFESGNGEVIDVATGDINLLTPIYGSPGAVYYSTVDTTDVMTHEGSVILSNFVPYVEGYFYKGEIKRYGFDSPMELTADYDHAFHNQYMVNTTSNQVNISITYGEEESMIIRDTSNTFDTNSCNVIIKDNGGATQYTVTLNNEGEAFYFYFDGTNWNYAREGEGKVIEITSNRTASVDFPDAIGESFWNRTGTTLSPKVSGDDISTTGTASVGILKTAAIEHSGSGQINMSANLDMNGNSLSNISEIDMSYDSRIIKTNNLAPTTGTDINIAGNITLTGTVDGIDIGTDVPLNTTHRTSNGSDHTYIDQNVTTVGTPSFSTVNSTTFTGDLNGTINTATTATTQSASDNSTKVATTAYVDTAVTAEDLWDRAGIVVSPKTAGDKISGTGGMQIAYGTNQFLLDVDGTTMAGDYFSVNNANTPKGMWVSNENTGTLASSVLDIGGTGADLRMEVYSTNHQSNPDYIKIQGNNNANGMKIGTYGDLLLLPGGSTGTESVKLGADGSLTYYDKTRNRITSDATDTKLISADGAKTLTVNNTGATLPDGSTATTQATNDNTTKVATTAFVEGHRVANTWKRTGTTLEPQTAGDDISTTGNISMGQTFGQNIKLTGGLYQPTFGDNEGLVLDIPFSETTGDKQYDRSQQEHDVTTYNVTVNSTSGKYATGAAFNGTTAYAVIPAPNGLPSGSADRSFEFVVKTNATVPGSYSIFSYGTNTNNELFTIQKNIDTLRVFINNNSVSSGNVFVNNTWQLVQITCTGTTTNAWVDGVKVIDNASLGLNTNANYNAYIGADLDTQLWDGNIDSMKVYDRILSDEEIRTHYLRHGGLGIIKSDKPRYLKADNSVVNFSGLGSTEYEIRSLSDLPTPVAEVITITESGVYNFKNSIAFGNNRIELANGVKFLVKIEDAFAHNLSYTGTGTFLSSATGATNVVRFLSWGGVTLLLHGDGATFMNLTGSFGMDFSAIVFTHANGGNAGSLTGVYAGDVSTGKFFQYQSGLVNWKTGWIIEDCDRIEIDKAGGDSNSGATGSYITINGRQDVISVNLLSSLLKNSSASLFNFKPTMDSPVSITSCIKKSEVGNYFATGSTGVISAFADNVPSSKSVTHVDAGASSGATFTTSLDNGYNRNDYVTHTGFTDGAYNGTFKITEIVSLASYRIEEVTYTATGTGTTVREEIIVSDVAHGLSQGTKICIHDTINYNSGYQVLSVLTDTFIISGVYVATETGAWDTGSLTEANKYIIVRNAGTQRNSKTQASSFVSGNTTATSISGTGTYDPLNLVAVTLGQSNELFTLVNAATGEMRYDGIVSFEGKLTSTVSAYKTGGAVIYRFRAYKTVGSNPFDAVTVTRGVNTTTGALTLVQSVAINPGDQFRIEVETQGSTNDLTISDYSMVAE